eukprot:scaffold70763_cov32-Tisochrysis_lutea.AAC.3
MHPHHFYPAGATNPATTLEPSVANAWTGPGEERAQMAQTRRPLSGGRAQRDSHAQPIQILVNMLLQRPPVAVKKRYQGVIVDRVELLGKSRCLLRAQPLGWGCAYVPSRLLRQRMRPLQHGHRLSVGIGLIGERVLPHAQGPRPVRRLVLATRQTFPLIAALCSSAEVGVESQLLRRAERRADEQGRPVLCESRMQSLDWSENLESRADAAACNERERGGKHCCRPGWLAGSPKNRLLPLLCVRESIV